MSYTVGQTVYVKYTIGQTLRPHQIKSIGRKWVLSVASAITFIRALQAKS